MRIERQHRATAKLGPRRARGRHPLTAKSSEIRELAGWTVAQALILRDGSVPRQTQARPAEPVRKPFYR